MNYMNMVLNLVVAPSNQELTTFEEATSCANARDWIEAMNEEMHSLKVNDTWSLVPLPKGYKPVASNGFSNLKKEYPTIKSLGSYKDKIYLLIYVDDMLLVGRSKGDLTHVKNLLKGEFGMKDLEEASKVLGIEIQRNKKESILRINQSNYCEKILRRFNMNDAKSMSLPIT
ncbi:uncharacterized protein LOC120067522 [Benincasa hispida]|uniref:uncharacterized protein LOC120067522 n=1 Tax=Benincasa hispida TaxID=102211 RepID=UPI0019012E7F|nr:uncharacterized protein LOC120067522 [Benincasa hispida]